MYRSRYSNRTATAYLGVVLEQNRLKLRKQVEKAKQGLPLLLPKIPHVLTIPINHRNIGNIQ